MIVKYTDESDDARFPGPPIPFPTPDLFWYLPETLALSYVNFDPITTWLDSSLAVNDLTCPPGSEPTFLTPILNGFGGADFVDAAFQYGQMAGVVINLRHLFMVGKWLDTTIDGACIIGDLVVFHWHGGHSGTGDQNKVINAALASANVTGGTAYLDGVLQPSPASIVKPVVFSTLDFHCVGDTQVQLIGSDRVATFTNYTVVEMAGFSTMTAGEITVFRSYLRSKFAI